MPICKCALCGGPLNWEWEHAFYREGFADGVNTQPDQVVNFLSDQGVEVDTDDSRSNEFIDSIKTIDGVELIADHDWEGETDPREFLPPDIVKLLD